MTRDKEAMRQGRGVEGARSRDVCVKEGDQSANEKEKEKRRTQGRAQLAAASCCERKSAACADSRKGGPPSERGSQCTCEGKEVVSGEQKRNKKERQTRGTKK